MSIEAYCSFYENKLKPLPAFKRPTPPIEEMERRIRNAISGKDSGIHLIEEDMRADMLAQFNPQPKLVK